MFLICTNHKGKQMAVAKGTIVCIEEAMQLGLPLDVEAMLIIETDGSDGETVEREIETAARVCRESGARQVSVAQDDAERASLWRARRSVSASLAAGPSVGHARRRLSRHSVTWPTKNSGTSTIPIDIRLVSATHRDLLAMTRDGSSKRGAFGG